MRRVALLGGVLTGCLYNPTLEVDRASLAMPRGTSRDVTVSIDGEPSLTYVVWAIDDPAIASVTPSLDATHLRVGGSLEGETVVHVNSHGQTIDIRTQVGPPAIVRISIDPSSVTTSVGGLVQLRASALDTVFHVSDITHDSRWSIRDPSIAALDTSGMRLEAIAEGQTTLDVGYADRSALAPITIFR